MFTPSLPTDNLYKFIFVAGIVLVIYSVNEQFNAVQALKEETISIRTQNDMLTHNLKEHLAQDSIVENQLNRLDTVRYRNRYKSTTDSIITGHNIERLESDLQLERTLANEDYAEMRKRQNDLLTKAKDLDLRVELFHHQISLLESMQWFGVCLTVLGGSLWYTKVQRHQDLLLRTEAEKIGKKKLP